MTLDVQTIADQIEEVSYQHGEPYMIGAWKLATDG